MAVLPLCLDCLIVRQSDLTFDPLTIQTFKCHLDRSTEPRDDKMSIIPRHYQLSLNVHGSRLYAMRKGVPPLRQHCVPS